MNSRTSTPGATASSCRRTATSTARRVATLCLLAAVPALSACKDDRGPVDVDVSYDDVSERVLAVLDRGLASGETLHVRVRGGDFGELDCASAFETIEHASERVPRREKVAYAGPRVPASVFEPVMDASWFEIEEPTPEMVAAMEAANQIIDICVMNGDRVVQQAEFSVQRAYDRVGEDGKFDGPEARVNSVEQYAELCVADEQLGEIPFFPAVLDENGDPIPGDYETFNCLDAIPIPTAVTDEEGNTEFPADVDHDGVPNRIDQCDSPMHLDSFCERNAVPGESNGPRVISATNDQGTHWVLLCRKTDHEEGRFKDMAMLGHNPFTGKTCFFQNGLGFKTDGVHVTHPADTVQSDNSPLVSAETWQGIHGGLGSGIECTECHDNDPIIHTPWIDGAKWPEDHPEVTRESADDWTSRGIPMPNEDGEIEERRTYKPLSSDARVVGNHVIPKMGEDRDFFLGNNDSPYYVVNLDGQGWEMAPQLVNDEVAACTECHRMAGGQWAESWMRRQDLEDSTYTSHMTAHGQQFVERMWMPTPEALVEEGITTEEDFDASQFRRAIDFLQGCSDSWQSDDDWQTRECDPAGDECCWKAMPREGTDFDGTLPVIDLEGEDLARASLIALGAAIEDDACPVDPESGERSCATKRCNSCHAISPPGLQEWQDMTDIALSPSGCDLARDPEDMSQAEAQEAIACLHDQSNPDEAYVAKRAGILTTGIPYEMFPKLFVTAFGEQEGRRELARYKAGVGMPKGSHPKFTLEEYATVRKWFDLELPELNRVFVETGRPQSCDAHVNVTALAQHVDQMSLEGWAAVNRDNGIRMFSCTGDDPSGCYQDAGFRDVTAQYGGGVEPGFELVEIKEFDFQTSFWTRSSADGRFVGNGGSASGGGSTISDLLTGRSIRVNASFDPGFFPDNSGFIFQSGFAGICKQSLLETDFDISFQEAGCIRAHDIDLYQHVARGTEHNRDYFVITSQHVNDPGSASTDPRPNFGESAQMVLTPLVDTGSDYRQEQDVSVASPYEGDAVLSASGKLVITRQSGPNGTHLGYVIREFEATPSGESYAVNIDKKLATVCMEGMKPVFSYDERFFVTQHYNGDGTADVWLVDLLDVDADGNARRVKITTMPAGVKALFPHFISNGWLYFLVRDGAQRSLVASNAAVVLAQGG